MSIEGEERKLHTVDFEKEEKKRVRQNLLL